MPNNMKTCDLCGARSSRILYQTDEYNVLRCANCSLIFVDTSSLKGKMEDLYASDIYEEYSYPIENLHEKIADLAVERVFHYLPANLKQGRLLDIGCGKGTFLRRFQEDPRGKDWQLTGIDISPENIEEGKRLFGLDLHCEDIRAVNWPAESFDVITLWDTIEHLEEARSIITEAARLLKKGGLLILTTPNVNSIFFRLSHLLYRLSGGQITGPVKRLYNPFHVKAFSAQTLTRLMKSLNLSPRIMEEKESYVTLIAYPKLSLGQKVIFGGCRALARIFSGHHEIAACFIKETEGAGRD